MLEANDLHIRIGPRLLLDRASFLVGETDKVGLVGVNGAGKTTLMRVLGDAAPASVTTSGTVRVRGSISYLPQVRFLAEAERHLTALEYVSGARKLDEASRVMADTLARVEADPSIRNVQRFSDAEEAFRDAGGYAAEAEIHRIVAGVGLPAERLDRPLATLSGGERRRVELARTLFAGADTLLLDEPSNHLDADAKAWLMGFLRGYRGAVVVVSHDLHLLDTAITRVLHLERGDLDSYKGTYSEYLVAREADAVRLDRVARGQAAEIDRLKRLADSMRHSTQTRARKAKSLDTRVERLERDQIQVQGPARRVRFRLPEPPHAGNRILRASDLRKAFDRELFEDVSLDVGKGERLLVIGLNGAGKTTLLRILAGRLEPDAGEVGLGTGVRVGYYAQEHEDLTPGKTALEHLRGGALTGEQEMRSLLGMFTLRGDAAFQDVATLSGGEKTKLSLAQLVTGAYNLLLLDEPTNNLDPASREAITEALASWPGTLVIVSHDEEFVARLEPTHALIMPEGDNLPWSPDLLEIVGLA
jgi:ATPase subunit of ABC transporter with duplicated ATPase domains